MKVKLVELDRQARAEGKGFMARLKARWNEQYGEYQQIDAQCLRDNASRFGKEQSIINILLVRKRNKDTQAEEQEAPVEQSIVEDPERPKETEESEQPSEEMGLQQGDEVLQKLFQDELKNMAKVEERMRIGEISLPEKIKNSANRILDDYLWTRSDFEQITDAVYAMGCAIKRSLNKEGRDQPRKENRRITKCRQQLRKLRQQVARMSNEIHRRRIKRKLTPHEREILHVMREQAGSKLENEHQLRLTKEKWLDQMRVKRVKLEKMLQKEKRIKDNRLYQNKEGKFYQMIGGSTEHTGQVPSMEKFTNFWGGIWEDDEKTIDRPWMEVIGNKIREKVHRVEEFKVSESDIEKIIKKRKNWTAPVDGIENYWWKVFKVCWRPLSKIMNMWVENNATVPKWLTLGRTVLIPKAKDLSSERDYRPITCLNTSYKIFTGVLGNYMKYHAETNEIWDRNQMGTVDGVLGTVDQLSINNCIMDEV